MPFPLSLAFVLMLEKNAGKTFSTLVQVKVVAPSCGLWICHSQAPAGKMPVMLKSALDGAVRSSPLRFTSFSHCVWDKTGPFLLHTNPCWWQGRRHCRRPWTCKPRQQLSSRNSIFRRKLTDTIVNADLGTWRTLSQMNNESLSFPSI